MHSRYCSWSGRIIVLSWWLSFSLGLRSQLFHHTLHPIDLDFPFTFTYSTNYLSSDIFLLYNTEWILCEVGFLWWHRGVGCCRFMHLEARFMTTKCKQIPTMGCNSLTIRISLKHAVVGSYSDWWDGVPGVSWSKSVSSDAFKYVSIRVSRKINHGRCCFSRLVAAKLLKFAHE